MAARNHVPTANQYTIVIGGNFGAQDWVPPSTGGVRPLGGRDQVETLGPVTDAATQFVQWMDPDSFRAYIAAARSFGSATAIDNLSAGDPRGQLRAVWGAWENVCMAFLSLNIPITSWERLRRVWAFYFGEESYEKPLPTAGAIRASAKDNIVAAANRRGGPNWLAQNFGGADVRVVQIGGLPPSWLVPRYLPDADTVWGGPTLRDQRRGRCSQIERPDDPTDNSRSADGIAAALTRDYFAGVCVNPTQEWQTFMPSAGNEWAQQDRLLVNRFVAEAAAGIVDPMAIPPSYNPLRDPTISQAIRDQMQRGEVFEWGGAFLPTISSPARFYRPTPGAFVPAWLDGRVWSGVGDRFTGDATAEQLAPSWRRDFWIMRELSPRGFGQSDAHILSVNYFPSLFAYWSMLFMPIPGLRVDADPALMFAPSETDGLSLVEYINAVGADQLVREVRRFVTQSNVASSAAAQITGDGALYANAPLAILDSIQNEVRSAANDERIAQAIASIARGTSESIGSAAGPVGRAWGASIGAVIGGLTNVGLLIRKAFDPPLDDTIFQKVREWPKDMFGNLKTRYAVPSSGRTWARPFLPFFVYVSQVAMQQDLNETARLLAEAPMPNEWPDPTDPPTPLFGSMPFNITAALGIRATDAQREALRRQIEAWTLNPVNQWTQEAPGLFRRLLEDPQTTHCAPDQNGNVVCSVFSTMYGAVRVVPQGWTPPSTYAVRLDGVSDMTGGEITGVTPGPHTVTASVNGEVIATIPVTVARGRTTVVTLAPPSGSGIGWLAAAGAAALGVYLWRRR